MKTFTDQIGNIISLAQCPPKRIISLVPSQTELLFDLGLDDSIVGITKFCIHPKDKTKNKIKVGGTKNFHIKKIVSLKPDLIIGNKEENDRERIEHLQTLFPVWMSDVYNLEDALDMIKKMGKIVLRSAKANEIAKTIQAEFFVLPKINGIKVAYLIWRKPYMLAGEQTFIGDVLNRCGFYNISCNLNEGERYPVITADELKKHQPQVVLLSSEPYPFKQKHIKDIQTLVPKAKIMLVNGEMFSWYGSRLLLTPQYLSVCFENL